MWRRGFDTPKNYDDNQGYCGGRVYQKKLKGKCGICGDPWDAKVKVGIQWCQIGMMRMVIKLKSVDMENFVFYVYCELTLGP